MPYADPDTQRAYWRQREQKRDRRARNRRRYADQRDYLLSMNARAHERRAQVNKGAHPRPWSAAECLLVMRDDLTVAEMACLLGRTYKAVARKREKLRGNSVQVRGGTA